MIISAVLAVSENDVIGSENALPWRLSNDLKQFKKNTLGKPMIMGRKTFESLPGLLPGRTSIILTRDKSYAIEGALIAHTPEDALKLARKDAVQRNIEEITIVGGGEIYRQFLALTDRFYLTRVHTEIEGDTHFFSLNDASWEVSSKEFHEKSDKNDYDHTFYILDKIKR
ncbi:MAG: dihydrofolate reductase [Sneathiella sp.]